MAVTCNSLWLSTQYWKTHQNRWSNTFSLIWTIFVDCFDFQKAVSHLWHRIDTLKNDFIARQLKNHITFQNVSFATTCISAPWKLCNRLQHLSRQETLARVFMCIYNTEWEYNSGQAQSIYERVGKQAKPPLHSSTSCLHIQALHLASLKVISGPQCQAFE